LLARSRPGTTVIVQEKLDGSCVCAARVGDRILALGRDGRLAERSSNEGRRRWATWVEAHHERFLAVLRPGERLIGEWLALVHGTRYRLQQGPFVAFDLMQGPERLPLAELEVRVAPGEFCLPALLHRGAPLAIPEALARLGSAGHHGALDPPEGAVWRLEGRRQGALRVLCVAKYVRHEKIDGAYLPENTGKDPLWNWP
jgi:hypothetical protein